LSVVELVRAGKRCEHKIEQINSTRVLRLRDRLLPLVALPDVLPLIDDRGRAGSRLHRRHAGRRRALRLHRR